MDRVHGALGQQTGRALNLSHADAATETNEQTGIRGGQAQAGTMMAAAALRPHKAPPARVPTRVAAALCAACFLLGVCVVNRSVRLPPPPTQNPLSFLTESPRAPPVPRYSALAFSNLSYSRLIETMLVDFEAGNGGNWSTMVSLFFFRYWAVPEHPGCPDKVMHFFPLHISSPPFHHVPMDEIDIHCPIYRQALTTRGARCHRLAKSSCNAKLFSSSEINLFSSEFI